MKFKILHTNDIHSRFENFAKISSKINELRDDNTLVLDAGDFNDFMRMELQGTGGLAGVELLEVAGYDAIAIGNNETFQGAQMLLNMSTNSRVQFLSSNLCSKDFGKLHGVLPSIIIKKNKRFLIIGTSPIMKEFYPLLGFNTIDYKEAIKHELEINKGQYDIVILLSHLGLREDTDIAETMEGIDLIIDGHSHTLMEEPQKVNNTIIHMSGCYGEHLGVFEFEFTNKVENYTGINLSVEKLEPNVDIINSLSVNKEKAIETLGKPLYTIDRDMWHDVMEENPITNLLADSLRDVLKCDIGLINSGVINGGVRKGNVSLKKLLEICPSPLNPTYMEMEGKHLREALEKSLYMDFCMQDGKGAGFRGKYLGRLHVSGLKIWYRGSKIQRIMVGDNELQEDRLYSVATSDYLQRGTGYESLKNNRNPKYNGEYLRDTIGEYLRKHEFLERTEDSRWIEGNE